MRLLLHVFLGVSFVNEAHSSSLRVAKHGVTREDPAMKEIAQEVEDAGNAIKESAQKTYENAQRGPGHYGDAKKPMMDGLEVSRMVVCWNRNKLLDHEQCMGWMVEKCKMETSGTGYCRKLRKFVKEKCKEGNEKGCSYEKQLGKEAKPEQEDPELKEIRQEVEDGGKAIEESNAKAFERAQRGPGSHGNTKKPMMDDVEVMRMTVCWGRNKLLEHEQCMEWMTQQCKKETTGTGNCRKLARYLKAKCKRGNEKGCHYAEEMGIMKAESDAEEVVSDDQDGDGVKDADDAFPDNPIENRDSDGDGIGDNTDAFPNDPTRAHEGEAAAAPAPAAAPSPGPAPMPMNMLPMNATAPLPSQGYNEHSIDYVAHKDQETMTRDWRSEWPMADHSEERSLEKICAEQPNHAWCKLRQSAAVRREYARSHQ